MIPVMKPWLGEEEVAAAAEAIRSGWVAQGPRVAEFESRFSQFVGNTHAVAVSSCTTGLHLVLHALGIGPGDDVIVPSLSFIATANAPRYVGARPVFADVDRVTQNLTVSSVEAAMTARARAVILVHQVGMPAEVDELRSFCRSEGMELIEDAACAAGSEYAAMPVGSSPSIAVFSFHPRKLLTTGEGGMIVTSDPVLAERLTALRQHAMSVSAADRHTSNRVILEEYPELGFNFRMTDIQAAIGLVQLAKLPSMIERRRMLASIYGEVLASRPDVTTPVDPPYGRTNYQSYSVVLEEAAPEARDEVMRHLLEQGISTRRGVMAAHLEGAYRDYATPILPTTEFLTAHSIILPLFHEMTEDDVKRVASSLLSCLE